MNKRAAAEYLGKTERAVERYTESGKLSVRYKPGKTRPVADYDERELAKLKHDLDNPSDVRPLVAPPDGADSQTPTNAVQLRQTTSSALERQASAEGMQSFALMVADALQGSQAPKMLLTLTDAAEVSGLSASHLLKAIHAKQLDGRKIGRGFKVRPSDLHGYAKQVWNEAPEYKKPEVKQPGDGLKVKGKR
jgi:excisionase family DNA binding protein